MKRKFQFLVLITVVLGIILTTGCVREEIEPPAEEISTHHSENLLESTVTNLLNKKGLVGDATSRSSSYQEFNGRITTNTNHKKYEGLSCKVRFYNDYLYVYVPRRYDVFKRRYVPSPKKGDVSIINTSDYRVVSANNKSIKWNISRKNSNAGSLWLPTTYYGNQVFSLTRGTDVELKVVGSRVYLIVNGSASGQYSTNVQMEILIY